MKRLGIDPGARHVGLAWHDDPVVPAHVLGTLAVRGPVQAVESIAEVALREGAEELVVGLPLRLDGREGASARSARKLARSLGERTGLPVVLWDERLTTAQVLRARAEAGRRGREGIDAESAVVILQSYVDATRGGSAWPPGPASE